MLDSLSATCGWPGVSRHPLLSFLPPRYAILRPISFFKHLTRNIHYIYIMYIRTYFNIAIQA